MRRFLTAGAVLPFPALAGVVALSCALLSPAAAQEGTQSRWHRAASIDSKIQSDVQYLSPKSFGTEVLSLRFTKPYGNTALSFQLFNPAMNTVDEIRAHLESLNPPPPEDILLYGLCDDGYDVNEDFSWRSLSQIGFCDIAMLEEHASLQISLLLDARELAAEGAGLSEVHSLSLVDAEGNRTEIARLRDMDLWLSPGGPTETAFGSINFEASGEFRYADEIRSCGRILSERQQKDLVAIHYLREMTAGRTKATGFEASLLPSAADIVNQDFRDLERLEKRLGVTGAFCASCYSDFAGLTAGDAGKICSNLAVGPTLVALRAELPWSSFIDAYYQLRGERDSLEGWSLELTLMKSDGHTYRYSWLGAGLFEALLSGRDG